MMPFLIVAIVRQNLALQMSKYLSLENVMVNLDCQLDESLNHLGDTFLSMSLNVFPRKFN